jgi:hypothetical protein
MASIRRASSVRSIYKDIAIPAPSSKSTAKNGATWTSLLFLPHSATLLIL